MNFITPISGHIIALEWVYALTSSRGSRWKSLAASDPSGPRSETKRAPIPRSSNERVSWKLPSTREHHSEKKHSHKSSSLPAIIRRPVSTHQLTEAANSSEAAAGTKQKWWFIKRDNLLWYDAYLGAYLPTTCISFRIEIPLPVSVAVPWLQPQYVYRSAFRATSVRET